MILYRMTATFGKLDGDTLQLEPGLNILQAPNEWGKTTWCAFLLAMLYGMDTRAKSTRTALADKEHYQPWSGKPMEGRIDLNWQGRDITIERTTKGRIPLGVFRAYETESGMEIPELTAENCGQKLLGAELSVFRRSGFIRQSDLPVTQDDALRRRLNDLVTTGDESGDGAHLEQGLRELKNKCRYNRSGLIPQAQAQRDALNQTLAEQKATSRMYAETQRLTAENTRRQQALGNHLLSLTYQEAEADARRVDQAKAAWDQAKADLASLEAKCAALPSRETAQANISRIQTLIARLDTVQAQGRSLPPLPQPPAVPKPFRGMEPEEVLAAVQEDTRQWNAISGRSWIAWILLGAAALIGTVALFYLAKTVAGGLLLAAGLVALAFGTMQKTAREKQRNVLRQKYGSPTPGLWLRAAGDYSAALRQYRTDAAERQRLARQQEQNMQALRTQHASLCGNVTPDRKLQEWQSVLADWDALEAARRHALREETQFRALSAMARTAPKPDADDPLTDSREDTEQQLLAARKEHQHLLELAARQQAKLAALGDPEDLARQLEQADRRIQKLEDIFAALTAAQQTLAKASAHLQRRFAPRITHRAQELMARMTDGRYDRLTMGEDFSIHAGAQGEITLHDVLWRSEGTTDQLYLALRLSVADALIPNAPLILDDALIRFDESRMCAAVSLLQELSESRQILLFTCQKRERAALEKI